LSLSVLIIKQATSDTMNSYQVTSRHQRSTST